MAVGFAPKKGNKYHGYEGRITPFVVMSCMMAAMGGVIFGYDIGISGGVTSMDSFLQRFFPEVHRKMKDDSHISNYCKFDSQLLTAFTSSLYIAGLFSTFCASSVTQVFGRKVSILVSGAAYLAGTVFGGAATSVYMLIMGRIFLGVGVGFANQAVPLYLSEMAPPRHRGAFNNGFQLSIGIGVLSANFINFGTQKIEGGWGWRVSLALAAVPASILTAGAIFLPDTPNSLVQRGHNVQEVRTLLQKVRGTANVEAELEDMVAAATISRTAGYHQFRSVFGRKHRPQLTMAVAIPFFQQVTGINVIAFYAPILYRTIGLGESASLVAAAVVGGVVGLVATFISMLVVDRFGRRALFIVGGIQMLLSQVIVGATMAAHLGGHGGISRGYALLVLLFICVYVAGFGWSWGPLGWLVPSEIFPLEIRSASQSITVGVSFVFTFIIAQAFLSMLCHLKSGIFFFFVGCLALMTIFIYLLLPETKGIPIEHMEVVWRQHWFWKKIVARGDCDKEADGWNTQNKHNRGECCQK